MQSNILQQQQQMQNQAFRQPNMQAPISQDQINQVILAAQKKKQAGSTEQNDPEFAQMVYMIRYYNLIAKQQTQQNSKLSPQQMNTLRYQIQGYKHLAGNEPVPAALNSALDPMIAQESIAQKVIETAYKKEQPPVPSNPYSFFQTAPSSTDQRLLVPSVLPVALDPVSLRAERDRYIRARAQYRIKELENLPASITNDADLKLKVLVFN